MDASGHSTDQSQEQSQKTAGVCLVSSEEEGITIRFYGQWGIEEGGASFGELWHQLAESKRDRIRLVADDLTGWDSSLVTFVLKLLHECGIRNIFVDQSALPKGIARLISLATRVPKVQTAPVTKTFPNPLSVTGEFFLRHMGGLHMALSFLGEVSVAVAKLPFGRARFHRSDLLYFLRDSGAGALPIVTLISVLVGVILAFVGAVQLKMFGAQTYVADLVGLGMARDMGAMMAAIIMAGRTGASYAAQLGTMQVNEEIDALSTLGISPVEFLVLPRLLSLTLMLPLLCLYADAMGILGGALVGVGLFDITPVQYYQQTKAAIPLHHFAGGLFKSLVYGGIVALSGCLRGIQCGRSAQAVGIATTSAVVTAIVGVIVSCALLTVLYYLLGV